MLFYLFIGIITAINIGWDNMEGIWEREREIEGPAGNQRAVENYESAL